MPHLPLDIYINILCLLLPSRTSRDASVTTLISCLQANTVIREAALLSFIWEIHYQVYYTYSDKAKEATRQENFGHHYRLMYFERGRLDRHAMSLLEEISTRRSGRCRHAVELSRMGLDVYDILDLESHCFVPSILRGIVPEVQVNISLHEVTRSFWARHIGTIILREYAVDLWKVAYANRLENDATDFEEALVGLSCFFGIPTVKVQI